MRFVAILIGVMGCLLIGYGLSKTPQAPQFDQFLKTADHVAKKISSGLEYKISDIRKRVEEKMEDSPARAEKKYSNLSSEPHVIRRFRELENCRLADSDPCPGFTSTSYRDYYLDVLTTQHLDLLRYVDFLKERQDELTPAIETFAREVLLDNPHSEIQKVALDLLLLYPPNTENLQAITEPLRTTLDSDFLERGLEELQKKYQRTPGYEEQIIRVFDYQIRLGVTDENAEVAARALFRFVDEDSYSHFNDMREQMRKLSQLQRKNSAVRSRYLALDSALREYESVHRLAN